MATDSFFREVELPEQKSYDNGVLFPTVLSPITNSDCTADALLCGFEEAIIAHKPWLESLLRKRGVILFRGFPVTSPSDFNNIVEAFGFPEKPYFAGRSLRSKVVERIYTVNEFPPDKQIPFHHEMSYYLDPPSKLFFYCDEEPESGGETPIVLSHIIYEKMKEKHPQFVAKLEEHGVTSTIVINDEDHPSSFASRSWKSTYMTDDKKVAEERAGKLGTKLEWMGNDVKCITGPVPAIRFDNENKRKTWFNSLAVSYSGPSTPKLAYKNTFTKLGNGEYLSDTAMEDCLRFLEEECVAIPWKKGDVMLVNDLMVLHGRRPLLKPPRRILISLCK